MNFKIVLFAREREDGSRPVYLRAYHKGKCRYFPLNLYASPAQWDEKTSRFSREYPDWKKENDLLATYEQRARDAIRDFARDKVRPTFEDFERAVFDNDLPAMSVSVAAAALKRAAELTADGKEGTAEAYTALSRIVANYAPSTAFSNIDSDWLEKFEKHLRRDRGNGDAAVLSTLAKLRALCNRVKGAPTDWRPFRHYKIRIPKAAGGARALSLEDFRKIESVETEMRRTRFALDLFLLSFYLRGANMADLARLTEKNIVGGRIEFRRHKTGKEYSIAVSDKAAAILKKYAGESPPYLLPILRKGLNEPSVRRAIKTAGSIAKRSLRVVADRLNIDTARLSFYSARHTYATALDEKGVGMAVIRDLLGHDDERTTRDYVKRKSRRVLDAADELLLS